MVLDKYDFDLFERIADSLEQIEKRLSEISSIIEDHS